jgi:hypothetical protein
MSCPVARHCNGYFFCPSVNSNTGTPTAAKGPNATLGLPGSEAQRLRESPDPIVKIVMTSVSAPNRLSSAQLLIL